MKRTSVISYTRVSKSKQAQQGVSLDDQRRQHDAFANARNYQITARFTDVGPASYEENGSKREGFNDAWKLALRNDWDVMVTVPSRFTRTLALYDEFRRRGGRLICTELGIDATDEEIRSFLHNEIVANEQRQRLARPAQQRARAEGKLDGHTVPNWGRSKSVQARQAKAHRGYEAFEQYEKAARAEGARTPRELAEAFRKMGFKTPSKMPWKANNVRRVQETITQMKVADVRPAEACPSLDTGAGFPIANKGSCSVKTQSVTISSAIAQKDTSACGAPRDSDEGGVPIAEVAVVYPFTEDELAELRALLAASTSIDEDMKASLLKVATRPNLSLKGRQAVSGWIEEERASHRAEEAIETDASTSVLTQSDHEVDVSFEDIEKIIRDEERVEAEARMRAAEADPYLQGFFKELDEIC